MDWNAIADQLAKGQKLYEVFREGSELASRLASFERYNAELQAKADAFPAQLAQAAQDLQAAKARVAQTLADGAKTAAEQVTAFTASQTLRVSNAQKELAAWDAKILAQSNNFDAEYMHYHTILADLKAQIDQLNQQIHALEQIKNNLKSQLQGVA